MKKTTVLTLSALTISAFVMTACSSSGVSSYASDSVTSDSAATSSSGSSYSQGVNSSYDYDYEDYDGDESDGSSAEISAETTTSTDANVVLAEDKLVYRCYVDIETLDFDASYSALQDMMQKYGCVISSEVYGDESVSYFYNSYYSSDKYVTGRTDEIVIRVPSKNYKDFVSEYGELGNVTSKTQTVENITQEYYNTTAEVEGLKAEMERLQIMLEQATDIDDMITINQAITELQAQINSLTTQILTMDSDVAYSYVTMSLKEVVEYSTTEQPEKTNTFLDRLKNQCVSTWKGFLKFLENLLFAIIALIPAIVILAIILVIVHLIFGKKIKAYREDKKQNGRNNVTSASELNALLKYDGSNEGKTDEAEDKK